jgi:hypothetical protein
MLFSKRSRVVSPAQEGWVGSSSLRTLYSFILLPFALRPKPDAAGATLGLSREVFTLPKGLKRVPLSVWSQAKNWLPEQCVHRILSMPARDSLGAPLGVPRPPSHGAVIRAVHSRHLLACRGGQTTLGLAKGQLDSVSLGFASPVISNPVLGRFRREGTY